MIKKFQLGGKLQDAIMLFVQGLAQVLQVKPEQVILIAQQNPKALESAVLVYQQTQDINQAAQAFTQSVQKAKQGAKLQYLKSLKHQCAEDEELYYYKKGGKAGCGCKKKGGEVVKANMGVVANFKEDLKKKQQNQQLQKPKWTNTKDNELKKLSEKKNLTPQQLKKLQQLREEFKNSSNTKDYEVEEGKKGMKVEKNCGGSSIVKKFKAAKCGTKMKKHQNGGSLNGIPFNLTENLLLFLNKYGKRGNKIMDLNQLKLFKMKHSKPKFFNIPLYNNSTFLKINPMITPDVKTVDPPMLRYAQNGGELLELVPGVGTYMIGKKFINNPSWKNAGELALSGLGDLALFSGLGAGAGMALKAAKAAKLAKTAKGLNKFKKAEEAMKSYDAAGQAFKDGVILYGGSSAIKANSK